MTFRQSTALYWLFAIAAVLAMLVLAVGTARGQQATPPAPSPDKGQALAERLCSNCHLTGVSTTVPAGPPTMRGIANKPGQTGQHIADILIAPHAPMPDMHLSRQEILDILAYLQTLRTDKSAPPLQAPPAGSKPKFPSPS